MIVFMALSFTTALYSVRSSSRIDVTRLLFESVAGHSNHLLINFGEKMISKYPDPTHPTGTG